MTREKLDGIATCLLIILDILMMSSLISGVMLGRTSQATVTLLVETAFAGITWISTEAYRGKIK